MAVAIFLGLLFGGGVALALRQIPDKLQDEDVAGAEVSQAVDDPTPTPLLDETMTLEILLPEQQSLIQEETVTISGKTNPGALVATTSVLDESVTTAGDDGTFSATVSLIEGANELLIVSMLNENDISKTIIVNYSSSLE